MIKFASDQEAFIWAQFAVAHSVSGNHTPEANTRCAAYAADYADKLLKYWRERNSYEEPKEEGPFRSAG